MSQPVSQPLRHLVTGAGSGIGRALARRLRDRGDELVLVVRDPAKVAAFPDATVIVADLADPAAVEGLRLPDGVDALDSVIHSAGVVELGEVADLAAADVALQVQVNLVAPMLLTRLCLPALRARRGLAVFVNSTSGLQANPGWSAYAASKFGLRGFADALRAEEAGRGVRVTSFFPSRTATPMQAQVHEQEGVEYDAGRWMSAESVAEALLGVIDLPRDATLTEITMRTGPAKN